MMTAIAEAPSSQNRRLAIAQRPGPNGSRVSPSRKPSLPRLGDLASITNKLRGVVVDGPASQDDDVTSNLTGSSSESTSSKASQDRYYATPDSSPPTPGKPSIAGNTPSLLSLMPQLPQPISSFRTPETRRLYRNDTTPTKPAWEPSPSDSTQSRMNSDRASFRPLATDAGDSGKHVTVDLVSRLVSLYNTGPHALSPSRSAVHTAREPIGESLQTPSDFLAFWRARWKLVPGGPEDLPDLPTQSLYHVALACTQVVAQPRWRDEEWQKGVARYLQQTGRNARGVAGRTVETSHDPFSAASVGTTDDGSRWTRVAIPPKTKEDAAREEMILAASRAGKINAYQKRIAFNDQPSPSATGVARSIRLEHSMALAITRELLDIYPRESNPGQTVVAQAPSRADRLHRKLQLNGLLSDTAEHRHVHIFVDMSNIFIGFEEHYRTKNNIPKSTYMHVQPTFFLFRQLAHILERDRNVVKRKLAGSVANAHEQEKPPAHFVEAESAGYETAKMLRVAKHDNSVPRFGRKSQRYVSGPVPSTLDWTTTSGDESGEGSGSSPVLCPRIKLGEQGVDENLHLGMQSSLVDYDYPGTMVLATGDAKEAEFSEGFAHYAMKAMDRGWNVEVISWKKCLSSVWRRAPFADKYSTQFRIVELDTFYEDLLADWLEPSY